MAKEKLYFRNLDSIRFIAALMVFLGHGLSPAYTYLPIHGTIWERILYTISNGTTGVSIFFVLSGFLITYLLVSEYELNSRISIKNFYIRRVLRIWPLYFLVVAFSFLFYPFLKSLFHLNNPLGSNIAYYLTFLSNFDIIHIQTYCAGKDAMSQSVTWSVAVEEQFYLFWPLIFTFLPKRSWLYMILLVIAASIVFRLFNDSDDIVLHFHTLSVLLDLGIGGLMALLIKKNRAIRGFFENTSTLTHAFLFICSFALILWSSSLFNFQFGSTVARVLIALSFALIISSQAITKKRSRLNLGNMSFANYWGKYTYGIYLIHPIALTLVDIVVRLLHLSKAGFTSLFVIAIISFLLTLLLSWLSYQYYESKFLALKDRFTAIKSHE